MILAIETATAACSVAVADADGRLLAEVSAPAGPAHTQRLLADIHHVLGMAGAAAADVRTVVVGLGPGTFTGLRIGVATARALAQAVGARLVGVPTLAGLALALAEGDAAAKATALVALIDGKRSEVFAACYLRGRRATPCTAPRTSGRPTPRARARAGRGAGGRAAGLPGAVADGHRGRRRRPPLRCRAACRCASGALGHGAKRGDDPARLAGLRARAWSQGADEVLPHLRRAPDAERWTARAGRRPAEAAA